MMRLLMLILVGSMSVSSHADRILLTNDDGYDAPGVTALYDALTAAGHDVVMVAPAEQQSGSSASMSSGALELTRHSESIWSVGGRPADAVRIGLFEVMKDNPPDLVISGTNFGQNSGRDAIVSGTVGAAVTALGLGFPAIAISAEVKFAEMEDRFPSTLMVMPDAAALVVRLLESDVKLPEGAVLNINYPAVPLDEVKGHAATMLSDYSLFGKSFAKTEDGRYQVNFNMTPPSGAGTDSYELSRGYVTYTRLDGTYNMKVNRALRNVVREMER